MTGRGYGFPGQQRQAATHDNPRGHSDYIVCSFPESDVYENESDMIAGDVAEDGGNGEGPDAVKQLVEALVQVAILL